MQPLLLRYWPFFVFSIRKKVPFLLPHRKGFCLGQGAYQDLAKSGPRQGLMTSIVLIGTVILQSAINQLGTNHYQCTGRSPSHHVLCRFTDYSYRLRITTFISQNFGAEQFHRIKKALPLPTFLSWVWSVLVAALLFFTSPSITSFISGSTNPDLIANASLYLQISSCFYPI